MQRTLVRRGAGDTGSSRFGGLGALAGAWRGFWPDMGTAAEGRVQTRLPWVRLAGGAGCQRALLMCLITAFQIIFIIFIDHKLFHTILLSSCLFFPLHVFIFLLDIFSQKHFSPIPWSSKFTTRAMADRIFPWNQGSLEFTLIYLAPKFEIQVKRQSLFLSKTLPNSSVYVCM